jgi:hypothetical protein
MANYSENTQKALSLFQKYDIDTQLALLWFGYLDIKDELANPTMDAFQHETLTLYNEIKALPQEDQVQPLRDLLSGANSNFSQTYRSLNNSSRRELWYLLGVGMERDEIVGVPSDYKLPEKTHEFSDYISGLDFEKRVEFMQAVVQGTGATAAKS